MYLAHGEVMVPGYASTAASSFFARSFDGSRRRAFLSVAVSARPPARSSAASSVRIQLRTALARAPSGSSRSALRA